MQIVWVLFALALASFATPCWAQDRAALAEGLFEQGREAMRKGDYAVACGKFRESNRIDPQVGTRLNLATCNEKLGKLATAWALYQNVRDELEPSDDRRPIVQERLAALRDRVPRLTLVLAAGAPDDTTVHIGETEVRGAGFATPLPVDPGKVELVVSASGRADSQVSVTVAEGETKRVEVAPGPSLPKETAEPPPPSPQPAPAADVRHGTSAQAIAGWMLTGVGIAAILAGAATGIAGLVNKSKGDDNCDDATQTCNEAGIDANAKARRLLTATTATWIAGAVLTGLGVTLVLTSDDGAETALVVEPSAVGAGLSLRHRF